MGILIGITGGIAAYKIPHLCRLLVKEGMTVKTVLTQTAQAFVAPLTLQAITNSPVYTDASVEAQNHMDHIELARWADKILIAPLSANHMAALAHGMADDLLTTLCLASQASLYVAPGMNEKMWAHPATQANIEILKARGVHFLGPDWGEQACGDVGWGRMIEPEQIVAALLNENNIEKRWQGLTIMVTAGPTIEPLDPVRYISNRSSGKMGYAIASKAKAMGAKVILVSGPCTLPTPAGVQRLNVTTATEMMNAVAAEINQVDIFISAAAVADFRVANVAEHKIKHPDLLQLTLERNVDILAEVANRSQKPFCVGFAAETQNGQENASNKLKTKKLDLIVFNDVKRQDIGFDVDFNEVTVISENQNFAIAKNTKEAVASQLLNIIGDCYDANHKTKDTR
jgi:phosphopantothenoylcysteine decarboxylase/phosphopantothenate--cysteine ligase